MVRNIQKGIPEPQVSQVKVRAEDHDSLKWEGEDEFQLEGIWYDVIKKEQLPDRSILYYCIADHGDTNLFSEMAAMVKKRQKDTKTGKTAVKNTYKLQTFYPSEALNAVDLPFGESQSHSYSYSLFYTSPKLKSESPPPRLC